MNGVFVYIGTLNPKKGPLFFVNSIGETKEEVERNIEDFSNELKDASFKEIFTLSSPYLESTIIHAPSFSERQRKRIEQITQACIFWELSRLGQLP